MPLPTPDFWDFLNSSYQTCLLTDNGSSLTSHVAQSLIEQGWKVVVLSFPPSLIPVRPPLSPNIPRVVLKNLGEEHLQQQLSGIFETYGLIGAFIHLHPTAQQIYHHSDALFNPEKAILKQVFLLAKHLKSSLNHVAQSGRSCLITVASLDGEFGLSGKQDFSAISGGLFGLTKTLNLEWEGVFCRSLDVSSDLSPQAIAKIIVAELHDPNHLIQEVGYTSERRVTLVCEASPLI